MRFHFSFVLTLVVLGASVSANSASAQDCAPTWDALPGLGGPVWTTVVFDDGTGPAVYAGGEFPSASFTQVVRWSGTAWLPYGPALDGRISILRVLDLGSGPALYVGGLFTGHVAVWDGVGWVPLPDPGANVRDLEVYAGELYAGGPFNARVRRLDAITETWVPVGNGTSAMVYSLATFDDGTGPALYAGGSFECAGTISTNCASQGLPGTAGIARWNGVSWGTLGGGITPEIAFVARVQKLRVLDLGAGPRLVAGGRFEEIGGSAIANLAAWDGVSWSGLGTGLPGAVHDMVLFDDRTDPAGGQLHVAGNFSGRSRKFNGLGWATLGGGLDLVARTMTVFDDGTGAAIFTGGDFSTADAMAVGQNARWRAADGPDLNGDGLPDDCANDPFIRGDANSDGQFDIADAIFSLAFLFAIGDPPPSPLCRDALDGNDDGLVTIADPVASLTALFDGDVPLAFPFPLCGIDGTNDNLDCIGPILVCP